MFTIVNIKGAYIKKAAYNLIPKTKNIMYNGRTN